MRPPPFIGVSFFPTVWGWPKWGWSVCYVNTAFFGIGPLYIEVRI